MAKFDQPHLAAALPSVASATVQDPAAPASGGPAPAKWSGDQSEVESDSWIGTVLSGTYAVQRLLGRGGTGLVYEAHHTRIPNKRYAIKMLHPEMAYTEELLARFHREAEITACITHPHVVDIQDVAETPDGRPYLVYEFLAGIELAAHVEETGPLPAGVSATIARQICLALEAAHAAGVIHRDLKPENIFLVGDPWHPHAKVLDFGLSRFHDTAPSTMTKTGVIMGTPSYMSPEQARGERVDHRTDVYGVGVILYCMLTGQAPFDDSSPQATLLKVLSEEPPRPRSIDARVPEYLELVVQRAMAKNLNERYQTIAELYEALEPYDSTAQPTSGASSSTRGASRPGSLHLEAHEVENARPSLVFYALLGLAALFAGLATAVSGAISLIAGPRTLSTVEFVLAMLVVFGTAMTPLILLLRHVRKTIWNNSARVLDLLNDMRRPLLAALTVYGVVALLVRVVASFSNHLGDPAAAVSASWPGWSILFVGVALLTAGLVFLQHRAMRRFQGRVARLVFGPGLVTLNLVLGAALIALGFGWQPAWLQKFESALTPEPTSQPSAGHKPADGAQKPAASAAKPADGAPKRASPEELADALAVGPEALAPLLERYPRDPAVLKPLALAYGNDKAKQVEAVELAGRLFEVAPEEVEDNKLRVLLIRAVHGSNEAESAALQLMSQGMGSAGPDILYDLTLSSAKLRGKAKALLEHPDVRKKASPALRAAYDLRAADSCEDQEAMLDEVKKVGDERAVAILKLRSYGTKRGCGKRRAYPCPAKCADQVKAFKSAVAAIEKRLE